MYGPKGGGGVVGIGGGLAATGVPIMMTIGLALILVLVGLLLLRSTSMRRNQS